MKDRRGYRSCVGTKSSYRDRILLIPTNIRAISMPSSSFETILAVIANIGVHFIRVRNALAITICMYES